MILVNNLKDIHNCLLGRFGPLWLVKEYATIPLLIDALQRMKKVSTKHGRTFLEKIAGNPSEPADELAVSSLAACSRLD